MAFSLTDTFDIENGPSKHALDLALFDRNPEGFTGLRRVVFAYAGYEISASVYAVSVADDAAEEWFIGVHVFSLDGKSTTGKTVIKYSTRTRKGKVVEGHSELRDFMALAVHSNEVIAKARKAAAAPPRFPMVGGDDWERLLAYIAPLAHLELGDMPSAVAKSDGFRVTAANGQLEMKRIDSGFFYELQLTNRHPDRFSGVLSTKTAKMLCEAIISDLIR